MRTLISVVALFLMMAPANAHAALGDHQWSQGWGVEGRASADGVGHIAVAGTFFSALDLGGGAFNPVNFLGGDVFLGRFDNNGNHVWSKQITPGGFGFIMQSMCAGPDGSIYVAGSVQNGDIDFGGGVITANGEVVVAGFEPDGTHRFSFLLGAGSVQDMDASNTRLALAGYTTGTVNFGGGPLVSAGSNDVMLGVLDANGAHVHSALFGDTGDQGAMTVALDNSNGVVLAGTAESDTDFGGGSLGVTNSALIAAGFSATGLHQWSFVHEGDFSPGGGILAEMDIDVSSTGNVALTGQFLGSVNLGGGALTSTGASADVFLAYYNGSGVHQSSASYGGNKTDTALGVAFDADDNLAIAGTFLSDSLNLGGAAPLIHSGGFGSDWFAVMYDDAGLNLFDQGFTGNGQWVMVPGFTSDGALLLSGGGGGNTDFGGGLLAQTSLFLAKFDGASGGSVSRPPAARNIELDQNSPNPFNPTTTIHFRVEEDMPVVLEVFDVAGRRVRTLRDGIATAGIHEVVFDGRDAHGRRLASGIYRYHLRSGGQSLVRSMVLVK